MPPASTHAEPAKSGSAARRAEGPAKPAGREHAANALWPKLALSPVATIAGGRSVASSAASAPPPPTTPSGASPVQFKCARCASTGSSCAGCGPEEELIQRKAAEHSGSLFGSAGEVTPVPSSSGQPLDQTSRSYFGARFNRDFGDVRVHTGANASALARSFGALAYTTGRDIVFGEGAYAPHAAQGQRLIAHELVHTVQQQDGRVSPYRGYSDAADAEEQEAERLSIAATDRGSAAPLNIRGSSASRLHRQPGPAAATPPPPVLIPDEPEPAKVHVSLSGLSFEPDPRSKFVAGDKGQQGMAAMVHALVPSAFTNELATGGVQALLAAKGKPYGKLVGTASGGESIPDLDLAVDLSVTLLSFLDNRGLHPILSESQREMLSLAEATNWLIEQYSSNPQLRAQVGVQLPQWYDAPLLRTDLLNFGTLLRQFATARRDYLSHQSDTAKQAAMVAAMKALLSAVSEAASVLEAIRMDVNLVNHPGYRLLWPREGDEKAKPIFAGTKTVPPPSGKLLPGKPVDPDYVPQAPFGGGFLTFARTQPALTAVALDPKDGPDARRKLLDNFMGWAQQARAVGPRDVALLDKPARANMKPHPSRLSSVPPIAPPLFDAALTTDYHFVMQLEFPDVFEAFASYVYRWSVARISDEEIKKGADISKAKGRRPELGDLARLRYTRTGKYAYEDIVRTIGNFKDSYGAPGVEIEPVLINAFLLRFAATSVTLAIDTLTTPSSEKKIPFTQGEGLYVVRCFAEPVTSGSGFIRAPSIAWIPVFAREPAKMAETRLAAAISNRNDAKKRLAEIQQILAGPGPIPDRDALVQEGEALYKVLESYPESLSEQESELRKRLAVLDKRIAELEGGAQAAPGELLFELKQERDRIDHQLKPITKIQDVRAKRSKEHDLSKAEQFTAVFVSDLGQTMYLALEGVEIPAADDVKHWYVSDTTTPSSDDASAYGKTKPDAIIAALHTILEGIHGYGRGQLSIEIDGKTHNERIAQSQGALLVESAENIATAISIAAVAAAPFTGGATLVLMIPAGIIGAAPSAYRILSKVENRTFGFDFEFAMDVVNIVGSLAGLGEVAVPLKMVRLGRAIMVIGIGANGLGVLMMGAQVVDQMLSLNDLPPGLRAAKIMQILGNAMVQVGIMAGSALVEHGRLKEIETTVGRSEGNEAKAHEQSAYDSWKARVSEKTQKMLADDPTLEALYREMDPEVRRVLTMCDSPCIPAGKGRPTAEQVTRIRALMDRLGFPPDHPNLREYLYRNRSTAAEPAKMENAIAALEKAQSQAEAMKVFDRSIGAHASADKGTASRVGDRWEFKRADGVVVREYTIGSHSELTKLGSDGFFESHHGIQDAWGDAVGIPGYSREDCPAIDLRDTHAGAPHQRVTARQKAREAGRSKRTYAEERVNLLNDMAAADVPKNIAADLLAKSDDYFGKLYKAWETKLRADGLKTPEIDAKLKSVFGTWSPPP